MANADKRVNLRMSEEQFDALQAKFEASKMKSMTSFILDSILTPSKEVGTKVPEKSESGKKLAPKKPMTLEEEYEERVKTYTKEQWADFEAVQHLLTNQNFYTIDGSHEKFLEERKRLFDERQAKSVNLLTSRE